MKSVNYLLAVLLLFHPLSSTALTTVTMKYYTVNGTTTKELHDAITINSPTGTAGLTEFKSDENKFEIVKNADGKFIFKSATINHNIVITLPKWINRSAVNDCVTEQCDKAMAALEKHEQNHSKLYQQLESRLNVSASQLPPHDSKAELYEKVHQLYKRIFNEIQEEQKLYDLRTNFGQKEGVSLSPC